MLYCVAAHRFMRVHSEIIADNLSKAGWSWGCVATVDREGRTIWIADAHRGDGKRFVVHADEKVTAFVELESVTRAAESAEDCAGRETKLDKLSRIPRSSSSRKRAQRPSAASRSHCPGSSS